MSFLEEMDREAGISPVTSRQQPKPSFLSEMDEEARLQNTRQPESPESDQSAIRFYAEKVAQGAIQLADLPQSIAGGVQWLLNKGGVPTPNIELPMASEKILGGLKNSGIDLQTQRAQTPTQKILGHGAEFLGATIGSMGLGSGAALVGSAKNLTTLGNVGRFLGAPKTASEAAKMAAMGAAVGVGGGVAQEAGVNPVVADLGSALVTPGLLGGAKSALTGTANVAKHAFSPNYRDASQRSLAENKAAEFFQKQVGEKRIPEAIRNIEAYNPSENLGIEGTTAEISKSVPLMQLERAKQGHISEIAERQAADNLRMREAIEGMAEGEHGIGTTQEHMQDVQRAIEERGRQSLTPLEERASAEEAGHAIRESLEENLRNLKAHRSAETEPLYEAVKNENGLHPKKTMDLIQEKLKHARGEKKKALMRAQNLFYTKTQRKQIEAIEKQDLGYSAKEKILSELVPPLPAETLKEIVSELGDEIGKSNRAGSDKLSRELMGIRETLLEDLEAIPAERIARKKYAELSEPISAIEDQRALGKSVKKDQYKKEFLMGEAELPSHIINKSVRSIKDARALKMQIEGHPETKKVVENYINNEVINGITDGLGNVDLNKLGAWKRQNQGAFELYPHLETKLKNIHNANYLVNQLHNKGIKQADSQYKGAFQAFMGDNPDQIVPKILSGNNQSQKMKKILEIASEDKSGNSIQGLKRGLVDDIFDKTTLASQDTNFKNNFSYPKYKKYIKAHKEALAEVFDENQMKILEKNVMDHIDRRQAVLTVAGDVGSNTSSKLTILDYVDSFSIKDAIKAFGKIKGVTPVLEYISKRHYKLRDEAYEKLIREALVDKDLAKFLLTKTTDKGNLEKAAKALKERSYLLVPAVSEKEDND